MIGTDRSIVLVTPSYHGDLERCRLLCESVDRFLPDGVKHYILVDRHDFELFRPFASSRRLVICETDILPPWFIDFRAGFSASARKIWLSRHTLPLRGWHVQQLRRIAIAAHIDAAGMLYCDSDMLFVRPFDPDVLWDGDRLRLYRKDHGISGELAEPGSQHRDWCIGAAKLFGNPAPDFPAHDYINNLVSWRRDHVVAMCEAIERHSGRHWVAAVARSRRFSECQIYGEYVDRVCNGQGHFHASLPLCRTYWGGKALDEGGIDRFVSEMTEGQVAAGFQSFTGTDPALLRRLIER